MADVAKRLADAFRRHCDIAGINNPLANKIARCVESGLASHEEIDRIIASLGCPSTQQTASLHDWIVGCLVQHSVALIPDADLQCLYKAIEPKPFTIQKKRIIQTLDGGMVRFYFAKEEEEGDNRWYRRLAVDKWYGEDMVSVSNALACALERAYHVARG